MAQLADGARRRRGEAGAAPPLLKYGALAHEPKPHEHKHQPKEGERAKRVILWLGVFKVWDEICINDNTLP